jgi:hypothetical protein
MKLLTVEAQVIASLIGAIVTIVSASLAYFLTKSKEIEVSKKQRKLERYDDLLSRLTEFVSNPMGNDSLGNDTLINSFWLITGPVHMQVTLF